MSEKALKTICWCAAWAALLWINVQTFREGHPNLILAGLSVFIALIFGLVGGLRLLIRRRDQLNPFEIVVQGVNGLLLIFIVLLFVGEMAWHMFGPIAYIALAIASIVPISALFALTVGLDNRYAILAMLILNGALALFVIPVVFFLNLRSLNAGTLELSLVMITPILNFLMGLYRLSVIRDIQISEEI
jgi:hypothetical protein